MKCQSHFLEKNKKKKGKTHQLKFLPNMLRIKAYFSWYFISDVCITMLLIEKQLSDNRALPVFLLHM